MKTPEFTLAEDFSLVSRGMLHRLLLRIGLSGEKRWPAVGKVVAAVAITWLPMLIFSLIQREAYGDQIKITFLRDFAVNVRFLIAVPILILAEPQITRIWRQLVAEFVRSGLVTEEGRLSFETAIKSTVRLRDHLLPETVLFVGSFLPSFFFAKADLLMGGLSNWHMAGAGLDQTSLAGWWFNLVSAPLFRFLLLRWIWRFLLATYLLWRISKTNLYLVATHSDMAAGLGFLAQGQLAFSPIVFAGGAVIASQVVNAIAYGGATLSSMKFPMIGYCVLAIVLLVVPLFVVTPLLFRTKQKALFEYGSLVTIHNQLFDRKWIRKEEPSDDVIMGNPDPSSLIDLGSSFIVIRQMGIVPIDKQTLIGLLIAAGAPMIAVVLYATPTDKVIHAILSMLGLSS
jgi:hypothetical protein